MSLESVLERIAVALEKMAEGGPTQVPLQFEPGPLDAVAPEPVEVTLEDVRAALVKLGREKGVQVLGAYGAKKISDLREEQYGEVVKAAGGA